MLFPYDKRTHYPAQKGRVRWAGALTLNLPKPKPKPPKRNTQTNPSPKKHVIRKLFLTSSRILGNPKTRENTIKNWHSTNLKHPHFWTKKMCAYFWEHLVYCFFWAVSFFSMSYLDGHKIPKYLKTLYSYCLLFSPKTSFVSLFELIF